MSDGYKNGTYDDMVDYEQKLPAYPFDGGWDPERGCPESFKPSWMSSTERNVEEIG